MSIVYLSLGSNLGNKRKNIAQALTLIAERVGEMLALSAQYETMPWGYTSARKYLNIVAKVETALSPEKVLHATQTIEKECGRFHKTKEKDYHDRPIDIDILLYDHRIIQTPHLTVPHPLMHLRPFVLQPLSEIAPSMIHPTLGQTIAALYDALQ